jgi:ankyrin repeat protein
MDGNTFLHTATMTNSMGIVEKLFELGADPDELNTVLGKKPLHMACETGNLDMVKLLIKMNAKLQPKEFNGQTPLHK